MRPTSGWPWAFARSTGSCSSGPRFSGSTIISQGDAIFGSRTTPLALLGSGHYSAGDFRFGLGAGPGLSHAAGTAAFRALGSFEYAPRPEEPKRDRDGDGIPDEQDACPDVAGVGTDDPRTNGCPPDHDHDGIVDAEDACPDVPGVRTDDPRTNGCPSDRDRDGVVDTEDACPDVAGVRTDDPRTNGCPSDRDHDGVADTEDACPDVAGVRTDDPKTNGCPSDRDKDGIPDAVDACPDVPGPANSDPKKNGCPIAYVKDDQIQITEQVMFRFGLSDLDPASDAVLGAVVSVMREHADIVRVRIEGHTDNRGSAALNKRLSAARAAAVESWLVKHGIDRSHLTSLGFGMEHPIRFERDRRGASRQPAGRVPYRRRREAEALRGLGIATCDRAPLAVEREPLRGVQGDERAQRVGELLRRGVDRPVVRARGHDDRIAEVDLVAAMAGARREDGHDGDPGELREEERPLWNRARSSEEPHGSSSHPFGYAVDLQRDDSAAAELPQEG